MSDATVNRELAWLHVALVAAEDAGKIDIVPSFKGLLESETDRQRNDVMPEPEDLEKLLSVERVITRSGRETEVPLWFRLWLWLQYETGAPLSDSLKLVWFSVDFDKRLIRFKRTKTGNDQVVWICPTVEAILRKLKEHAGNHVFHDEDGRLQQACRTLLV